MTKDELLALIAQRKDAQHPVVRPSMFAPRTRAKRGIETQTFTVRRGPRRDTPGPYILNRR